MTQADRERLSAFEMWVWRRMEKDRWVDSIINKEVLQRVQEIRSIVGTVRQRKQQWI